ncbi:MAG: ribonuclease HII [Candidatus Bathyarchaeota archaeon]|nr:ribonuclease HII [Candidatus Bathyarchaeota archaeon]
MLVAGIDEAGRGCVVGPLVVAGVLMDENELHLLSGLGVKDSKLLAPKKREAIAKEIINVCKKHFVVKVPPAEIDRAVESQIKLYKLNRLEANTMAQIVDQLKPDTTYVDAADIIAERFAQHIQQACTITTTRIVSEHKADKTYIIVSAASIIAKVERDKEIAVLRERYGDFGSGYLTDPKTPAFLKNWLKNHPDYPECIRKSWKPAKTLKDQQGTTQTKLG